MRIKLYFLIMAIVCLFFGLSMVFGQQMMTETYMVVPEPLTPGTMLIDSLYGCLLISFGIGLLMTRRASMSYGRRAWLAAAVVANALVLIVHIYAITAGWENSMGWSNVVLSLVLGIWGLLLLMREKVD